MYYRKNNIDISYQSLVRDILENGVSKGDRTGTGTISVFGRQIRHKMADGFPLLTTKRMSLNNISSELIWFLRGDTNIKYLLENKNYIWVGDAYKKYSNSVDNPISREEFIEAVLNDEEFCSKWGELGPIYGRQWRAWENFYSEMNFKEGDILRREPLDQLKTAIEILKVNPDSRRIIVSAWNPNDLDKMTLPPCHNFFQLYTRELSEKEKENYKGEGVPPQRAISLMWNQRSVK